VFKVTCTVKNAKSSASSLRWRLMHGGHVVSHGNTGVRRLQQVLNDLRKGRYLLHVQGQKGGTEIVIG
jgi:hypothetical protein